MSQYMILIYEDEASYATATPEVLGEVMEAHDRFAAGVESLGAELLGGEALPDTSTATTVRGSEAAERRALDVLRHRGVERRYLPL